MTYMFYDSQTVIIWLVTSDDLKVKLDSFLKTTLLFTNIYFWILEGMLHKKYND